MFGSLLKLVLKIVALILVIAVPIWVYLAFFASEPVFSVDQDVDLGRQTVASITEDPEEYPILPEAEYPEAYAHLRRIVDELLTAQDIEHRDLFPYELKIIDDDETLNAFCAPGGFIYVYTGIVKYLDAEDHFAGVLGHEIAHAERRHSALQLQREYGTQKLLEFVVLTTPMRLSDAVFAGMVRDLGNLSYGREAEADADEYSVRYLANTRYACDGTAGFFEKLLREGQDVRIPEWLSDHPDSGSRVQEVRRMAAELGCSTELADPSTWGEFQNSLPADPAEHEEQEQR